MNEEIKVRRGNVVLRVPLEQKSEYLAKGFDVINADGTVSEASVPNDVKVLQKAYVDHLAKIQKLEKALEEVKNKSNTTTKKAPTKEESNVEEKTVKPKTTRSKKTTEEE